MPEFRSSVLFVCTGNAGRSQMAQAMFREMVQGVTIESAGVDPWSHLHPMAVKLMGERKVSLEGHHPKHVDTVVDRGFDFVVTIGDPARAGLPKLAVSSSYWMHWDISDPADADDTPDSEAVFRRTMEAIEKRLPGLKAQVGAMPKLGSFAFQPGIGTGLWAKERFEPGVHLPVILEAGYRAIELNVYKGRDHFDWEDAAAVRELRKVADDLGMLVWSIHSPDLGSIAAVDSGERQRQIDVLKLCLDLAGELGAKAIPSHALLIGPFKEDPEGCEERMAETMAELAAYADGGPAQIAYENAGFPSAEVTRAWRILERLDTVSRASCGFALDTGHANIDGDLGEIEEGIGDRLLSLHLNDNDGKGDTHLAPGEGTVDWAMVKRILKGFRGVVMYEIERGAFDSVERMKTTLAAHEKYLAV
ncbi:MAG: TIM barrel protein [bacterium]|nr:TIM barrel protein [bacterium]